MFIDDITVYNFLNQFVDDPIIYEDSDLYNQFIGEVTMARLLHEITEEQAEELTEAIEIRRDAYHERVMTRHRQVADLAAGLISIDDLI